jgi:acyl-coenzyme A thioesterase PaaI-like protein
MNDQEKYIITPPELFGEKGWTELIIPDSYGNGRSFITGDRSSDRMRVKYFKKDSDNSVVARIWFGPSTEGPPGHVHGGSMAAILDEAMGISAWIAGHTVVAAKITIEYRKMLPLGTVTTVEAKVSSVNGKKVITSGIIYDDTGSVYAESEGLFISIPIERFEELLKHKILLDKKMTK